MADDNHVENNFILSPDLKPGHDTTEEATQTKKSKTIKIVIAVAAVAILLLLMIL